MIPISFYSDDSLNSLITVKSLDDQIPFILYYHALKFIQPKQIINMGCVSSEGDFQKPLSQDLQNQMRVVSYDRNDQEVDRFQSNKPEQGFDQFFTNAQESDQQFMAVKPWIGALVAPTNKPQFVADAPTRKLTLAFVNGFKIEDSRQNMFWGHNSDEIIYCAAALGIVMNANNMNQRYMGAGLTTEAQGFTDDVMALGVCPKRKLVVSGSLGSRPDIIVWDSDSMKIIARTKLGRNTRAVSSIRFSKDGKLFYCTDKHNDSNVYCFKADTAELLGQNKCGSDPVFDGQAGGQTTYAVATKRGVYFFEYTGSGFEQNRGLFNGNPIAPQIVITYNNDNKSFYSGTSTGDIYQWQGRSCVKAAKVHEGSVRALQWANGYLLSSGSKDFLLKVSKGYQVVKTFNIGGYAVSLDYFNGKFLVANSDGKVLSINDSGQQKQIMQCHSTGQTWGLATSTSGTVYTSCDDNKILEFNPKTKKVVNIGKINQKPGKKYRIGGASTLSVLPPNQQARGIAVNKSAGHVALGINDGSLSIRSAKNLNQVIFETKDASQWIEVLKYSPNNQMLAVGSHDNNIYVYQINGDSYKLVSTCRSHKSFITNLDWSSDGKYIQSNCGAYEYLFHQAATGKQLQSGATQFRDQPWATYTVKLGWWVQGIFPPATDGSHVNGVDRSKTKDIIITGDDWGFVNLYRNPALKGAKSLAYRAHSSHVVRVLFDEKDEYVYSVGGYDKTLMMWKYS